MRVLLCKIQCPFICFCKPSSHIYTPGPLKLENTPNPHNPLTISEDSIVENENENGDVTHQNAGLRSSLRKSSPHSDHAQKKKVQWVDFLGKELADVREFESSEAGDREYEGMNTRGCVCNIL